MKKLIISIIIIFGITFLYFLYWQLPPSINRKAEIRMGDAIIKRIDTYKETYNKLPGTNDWETIEALGANVDLDNKPYYQLLNDTTYALFFIDGFDGPYLMWSSDNRLWRIDFP